MNEKELSLLRGLVGGHEDMYHNSAMFRSGIDLIVGLLPFMVDGLEAYARMQEVKLEAMRKLLEQGVDLPKFNLDDL